MSQWIHSDEAPNFPLPFSQALRAGDYVYVSGQVGVNPQTRIVVGPTIEEQTAQCLRNIETILKAAGLTMDHVIKVNAILTRLEDFPGYNKVYDEMVKRPFPARTSFQGGIGDYLIEIDVVAYTKSVRGETV